MEFELWLFYNNREYALTALEAGVNGLVVDWEYRGKEHRQQGFDTQINRHTEKELRQAKELPGRVLVRINAVRKDTVDEVERAIGGGADEILVPMVRRVEDVDQVLHLVRGRCGVGILVETCDALDILQPLARLPLSRVYVGLNDFRIDRIRQGQKSPNLFSPIADGTLNRIRSAFDHPFGFGGLTDPRKGTPIPCKLLLSEMARLRCTFSFLRRSFVSDVCIGHLADVVPFIRSSLTLMRSTGEEELETTRSLLCSLIGEINDASTSEVSPHVPS